MAHRRENNIKTLDTIDTMNITDTTDTRHKGHKYSFCSHEESTKLRVATPLASGLAALSASQSTLRENFSSQVNPAKLEITYLSANLKQPTSGRRQLNVDFRTTTTPSGQFNKIVFNLTDRMREFTANLPQEWRDLDCYTAAQELFVMSDSAREEKWIGKGRKRNKWQKGKTPTKKIKKNLVCVLEQHKQCYTAFLWIEQCFLELQLVPVDNKLYPFRADYKNDPTPIHYEEEGGWL